MGRYGEGMRDRTCKQDPAHLGGLSRRPAVRAQADNAVVMAQCLLLGVLDDDNMQTPLTSINACQRLREHGYLP